MLRKIKNLLYFTVARYFRFFARIRLRAWNPRVVVITGSNGKTMCLHLAQVQLENTARYSFLANSAFGVPFDILGLSRTTLSPLEWIWLIALAPFCAWKKPYAEKTYVVEADCDRPGEGRFLGTLLKPEVCIWLSSGRTHSQLFEKYARSAGFESVEAAIAHEFGNFLECTSKLAIVNADNPLIVRQRKRAKARVHEIKEGTLLEDYNVSLSGSEFVLRGMAYRTPYLLPKETFYAIAASLMLAEHVGRDPTNDLSALTVPPGRSSMLRGIRGTILIDSSYNANVDSVAAILAMVAQLRGKKWIVLGDLTEQGGFAQEEHEKLARLLSQTDAERIILVGPRLRRFALPPLKAARAEDTIESFTGPEEALDYLASNLKGGEVIVFKGARFLEGIIEGLLENKKDAARLCRRERIWQKRRAAWGV